MPGEDVFLAARTAWPYPNSYPNQLAATVSVNE
jgi:hypothetical protein